MARLCKYGTPLLVVAAMSWLVMWSVHAAQPPAADAPRKSLLDDAAPDSTTPGTAQDRADLTQQEMEIRRIRAEFLRQEVSRRIETVQALVNQDPDGAIRELKRLLNMVLASTDIDASVREQLRTRVQQRIEQVNSRRLQIDQNRIRSAESNAQREAAKHLVDNLVQRDQKLEQLIDRVRSLLNEGYLGNADAFEQAEAVSRVAWELDPYSGTTAAAIFDS